MRLLWAGLSALLLSLPGALFHVPAPEAVTVRCADQRPLVSWNYSSQQPTNFTVQLLGSGRPFSAQTADQPFDLSGFVWSSPTQMFEFFVVDVTAEQESNRSEPSRSLSFSYDRLTTVDLTCSLTFPPINLTREGAEATLSMENPLHFYNELRFIKTSAVLLLDIFTESGRQHRQCSQERICKFSVDLPEDAEPCVNLTGVVRYGSTYRKEIIVQHIDHVCAAAPTDLLWLSAVLSVAVFVLVVSLLTVAVCKYRAWAFPKIPIPQTLKLQSSQSFRPSLSQPNEVYSPIQITEPIPWTTQDHESPSPQQSHLDQDQDQLPFLPEDPREDPYESAESTKTETLSLHSSGSEIEESNYERRVQIIDMDVGGDLVSGYTG